VWGDSITVPVAANLSVIATGRTVFDGSGIGETSGQVAARALANANTRSWIAVIWCGHNNFQLGGVDQIVSDIASMVNQLAPSNGNRFVVVSLDNPDTPAGIRGGTQYVQEMQINAQLQAMWPNNYLDARSALVADYDPNNAQDVQDHNNDVVPSSLRYDEIHFRQAGSLFAATLIRDFIVGKGW
jgi:hypothetical protein